MPDLTTLALVALVVAGEPDAASPIAGRVAFIDPMTGKLVVRPAPPAPAPRAAVPGPYARSDVGLVEVVLPDGSVMVDLEGRFSTVLEARLDEDGLRIEHRPRVAPGDADR